eukprot:CAMPEP_0196736496 /NCGR_PEP_ID=MMETSP1091-20130531/14544_1 /TAXON_ID=302021 /ORGANISM="Rhodomonas sp., Strain CCMP768" /LENGTH=130 /DNA_ID=CAMNT_0042080243 /DNA_START=81 /DNA_END=470 /DNA_ORIENTATION=-
MLVSEQKKKFADFAVFASSDSESSRHWILDTRWRVPHHSSFTLCPSDHSSSLSRGPFTLKRHRVASLPRVIVVEDQRVLSWLVDAWALELPGLDQRRALVLLHIRPRRLPELQIFPFRPSPLLLAATRGV